MPTETEKASSMPCSEFRLLVQQALDGLQFSEGFRQDIRKHRNGCDACCNFHDRLLQVMAVAPEIDPPAEYATVDQSELWNLIVRTASGFGNDEVQTPETAKTLPLGKLDGSKADPLDSHGRITDLGKFLLDDQDHQKLDRLVKYEQPNVRVERVFDNVYTMILKLQDLVARHRYVLGTMVLSADGTILASRFDKGRVRDDEIGVWALAAYHNAVAACQIVGHKKMMQLLSRTERGYINIANLQGLTLVTVIDADEEAALAVVNEISALSERSQK